MDVARRTRDASALHTGDAALTYLIRRRIAAAGPVPFAWFMEQALYHPEHGYYSSGRAAIGRGGDYFTNVSVGPLFGRLMEAQFAEMWTLLGAPEEFVIVEQGAHDGQFAHDVLATAETVHPAFFGALRYRIVEPFPILRARQIETLTPFKERVRWSETLDVLEPFCGIHFSNELLDAMPVHVVVWNGSEWLERHVADNGSEFNFVDLPIANDILTRLLAAVPTPQTSGYETEVNLAALRWVDEIARKLTKGFVVAVDYGFARDEFYAPHRTTGTLQCRARHQLVESPLMQIGEADITAHVEWTSVAGRAVSSSFELIGFTDQHHFITGLLTGENGAELIHEQNPKTQRTLHTLLDPGFLGMKFQFLVLGKNIAAAPKLAGLRFARDARAALAVSS
ncbi:SAM-dependent methyltransferase [soil metagenome]